MKKLSIWCSVFLVVFLIYLTNMDKKVYYLSLGDSNNYVFDNYGKKVKGYSYYVSKSFQKKKVLEKYMYQFSNDDSRITDLINFIHSNKEVNDITIKNALIKADLVTLKFSGKDVFQKLTEVNLIYNDVYNYIDDLAMDFNELLNLMRSYCKEDILFVGFYNPYIALADENINDVIDYLNKRYKEVCDKYNVKFVDISTLPDAYFPENNSLQLKEEGYKEIGEKVVKDANKYVFEA